MPSRRSPRAIRLLSARRQLDTQWLVVIEGISTRLSAAAIKSYTLFVKKSERPALGDDEYLVRDLVGLTCYLVDNKELPMATVEGVVPAEELGGGKLMHSMLELRIGDSDQLCLVPLVPSIVTLVDIQGRRIEMDPPLGLLDLTYTEVRKSFAYTHSRSLTCTHTRTHSRSTHRRRRL